MKYFFSACKYFIQTQSGRATWVVPIIEAEKVVKGFTVNG
jgi:hypothetical protein